MKQEIKKSFKIPEALNENGTLIKVELAEKNHDYYCPNCKELLVLKKGNIRKPHFSHGMTMLCSGESAIHKICKMKIKEVIEANSLGAVEIRIEDTCERCNKIYLRIIPRNTFTSGEEERRVGDYICDVVGLKNDKIVFGIEVFKAHRVEKEKSENMDLYWVELKANDILNDNINWKPTQKRIRKSKCDDCKKEIKSFGELAEKWELNIKRYSTDIYNTKDEFFIKSYKCEYCCEEIPVMLWEESYDMIKRINVFRPKMVQQVDNIGWCNICLNCMKPQIGYPIIGVESGCYGTSLWSYTTIETFAEEFYRRKYLFGKGKKKWGVGRKKGWIGLGALEYENHKYPFLFNSD